MKNSKFISLILVFVFALACFPGFGASASTIKLSDDDYANASAVLKLICPDFPLSDGEITTRAEFVAAVVSALDMPETASGDSGYTDVAADYKYAAAVSHAGRLGLISNVDLFYPESPVTYAQAIKIVMSAAGYGRKAELTGGFPTGYLMAANDAGVGEGLSLGNDDSLTHAQATELIFEACCTDMLEATSFGSSYSYGVTEGKNIFSVYHNIYMAQGVVKANGNTGLRSIVSAAPEGFITVDGINYRGDGLDGLIGKNVRIFYGDDNSNTVVYAYECGNETVSYTSRDSLSVSGTSLTVQSENSAKDIRHSLDDDYTIIYNGKCFNTNDVNSCINTLSGSVSFTDNNDNGSFDVITVRETEYGVIGSVNEFEEKIYDKYKRDGIVNLALDGVKYSVKESDGTPIELGELEENDAVGFVVSKDHRLYEIIRYSEKIGGTIDYITADGKVAVANNEYRLSDYYSKTVNTDGNIRLGAEVIVCLGEADTVIYIQEFTSSVKYGFFVAAGETKGLDGKVAVKIFGDDGQMHEYELADKLKLDGTPVSQSEAYPVLEAIEGKELIMRVVKYSVNATGELTKLYQAAENTEGTGTFLTRLPDEAGPILFDDNTNHSHGATAGGKLVFKNDTFYPYFNLAPECTILRVPADESSRMEDKYYALATTADVKAYATANGDSIECYGYDVDIDGASFILWVSDLGGASSVAEEAANAIVESVTRGAGPDGGECYVVKLFADGKAEKYYSTIDSEADVAAVKPGDIVQVSTNTDREITAINVNFIYSSKTVTGNATDVSGYNGGRNGFAAGYFYNFSGKSGIIVRHKTIDEIASATSAFEYTDIFPINLGRGKVYFVKFKYNRAKTAIEEAIVHTESDTSSIESFYSAGKDADYVVQRARFHDVSYTVVYTN